MGKAQEKVRKLIKARHTNMKQVSLALGEIPQLLGQQMTRTNDIKFERLEEILECLGYRCAIIDVQYRKVTPEYARTVVDKKKPLGLFWSCSENGYFVIDNRKGEAVVIDFESKDAMEEWLHLTSEESEVAD